MPIGLRSMITKENHGEWYRQMYKSLHQPKVKYDYRLAIDNQSIYLKILNLYFILSENFLFGFLFFICIFLTE